MDKIKITIGRKKGRKENISTTEKEKSGGDDVLPIECRICYNIYCYSKTLSR